ncbi:MAG: MerC domain-containing protein [Sphingomonas sp.]|uniref:MerC domain-containing protein n=1 Tax=Sphingomonas sp. TaxID=28214 RepID=UPI0022724B4D|nr:MerC domain-containing protein [Sphingomonas sp.]MCX8474202.1 MerC domain-containing protein [Sphingomonas sp.]
MRCEQQAAGAPVTDWLDRAAVGASVLCLIHCAGLPLLLAVLPSLSRLIAIPEDFHLWMLAFAIPTSAAALAAGRRSHGENEPLALGGLGLALMAAAALCFTGAAETATTIVGSLCLASAHIRNWRRRRRPHRHG